MNNAYKAKFDVAALKDNEKSLFSNHAAFLGGQMGIQQDEIQAGMVIEFLYKGEYRLVWVTNPSYPNDKNQLLLHGLTLYKTDRTTIMQIYRQFSLGESPQSFYQRVLKSVVNIKDNYRSYFCDQISMLTRVNYTLDEPQGIRL